MDYCTRPGRGFNNPYITEPDFFMHEKPIRIMCNRIEVDGHASQKVVLSVPLRHRLEQYTLYELVIRQAIPDITRGLPLYIRAIEEKAFVPEVSVGFGFTSAEGHRKHECCERENEREYGRMEDGERMEDECCETEVVFERVEAMQFPVTMFGYGNIAFGNDLVLTNDEPFVFITLYLNNKNEFVIVERKKPCCRKPCRNVCRPKRLIKRVEMIERVPVTRDNICIDTVTRGYGREHVYKTHDCFSEGYNSYGY